MTKSLLPGLLGVAIIGALGYATTPEPTPFVERPVVAPCDAQNSVLAKGPVAVGPVKLALPTIVEEGQFIDATLGCGIPPEAERVLSWTIDGKPADRKSFRVTSDQLDAEIVAKRGKHTVTVRGAAAVVVEGRPQITTVDESGIVEVVETLPAPVVETLAVLAGADAGRIAEIYAAHAALVESGDYTTLGTARQGISRHLQRYNLADNKAVAEVNRRLELTIGPEDQAITPELRAAFTAFLRTVVVELGAPAPTPTPSPVVTATKLWIVAVDRFEGRTPAQGAILTDVDYWDVQRANGHNFRRYDVTDPDAARYEVANPPSVVVQNAQSGKVLGVEPIPANADRQWADGLVAKYGKAGE